MTSCAPWALSHITSLPVETIELILSRQRDDGNGIRIAMDGSFSVDPVIAQRVLELLGYRTQMAAGGMSVREAARISCDFPGGKFYLSTGRHAAVVKDGMVFDNAHPDGVAPDQYPLADDVCVRVICTDQP